MSEAKPASVRTVAPAIKPGDSQIAGRILENVKRLTPRFRERALETERLGRVPDESIRELTEAGLFKTTIPVEYGGYALNPAQLVPIFAEIARACGSTGWVAWLTATGVPQATFYSHEFQAELFGPGWDGPLQSGTINNFAPGVARRVPGGLMVSGKWGWCSGCHHTRFHIISVMYETEDGGKETVSCQVPHEQVEIVDDWHVMGMKGTGSNSLAIREEVFVPDHRILKPATAQAGVRPAPVPSGLLFRASFTQLGSVTVAALSLGLSRAAIEELQRKVVGRRIVFTTHTDQSKAAVTHLQLAEMWAKLNACEAVVDQALRQIEAGATAAIAATPLDLAKLRAAVAYVCIAGKEISDLALRAGGASSIQLSSPLQRIMRDATTLSMHALTYIETAYEDLGRQMCGLPGFSSPQLKADS